MAELLDNNYTSIIKKLNENRKAVFILDYDGTLNKITQHPDEIFPSENLLKILDSLAQKLKIIIASGRSKSDLERFFSNKNLVLYGEHGAEMREDGKWTYISENNNEWMVEGEEVLKKYYYLLKNPYLEKKSTCLTLHYEEPADRDDLEFIESKLRIHYENRGIDILMGHLVIDLRLEGNNKGLIVEQYSMYDFILVAGDDTTDFDMFRAIKKMGKGISIFVGKEINTVTYRTENYLSFIKFLQAVDENFN